MKSRKKAFTLVELSIVLIIIGLIVTGIVAGKSLVAVAKLSGARSATNTSPIYNIEGVALWLDATSAEAFTVANPQDGQFIDTWYDLNPQKISKHNATQSGDDSLKPTYNLNGINGLPSLTFNGSSEYLAIPYSASINTDYFSIFLVVKVTGGSGVFRSPFTSRDGVDHGIMIYARNSDTWASLIGLDGGSFNSRVGSAVILNEVKLLNASYSSGGLHSLYEEGSLVSSDSPVYVKNSAREARIGAGATEGAANLFFYGDIGEIILFNRGLSPSERESVEEYLSNKWGIDLG